jgi:hypothetical protein
MDITSRGGSLGEKRVEEIDAHVETSNQKFPGHGQTENSTQSCKTTLISHHAKTKFQHHFSSSSHN